MLDPLRQLARRTSWLAFARQHVAAVRLRRTHPEGIVPPAPKRVIVEPTNACNLGCSYCGNKDMLRPKQFLSMDMFEQLIEQMLELGVPRMTLHTVGEPTLHPRLPEMVQKASSRGIVVSLSTNATL